MADDQRDSTDTRPDAPNAPADARVDRHALTRTQAPVEPTGPTQLLSPEAHTLASTPPPGAELPPGARVGRYVILKRLGSGGMGIVYTAYDEQLDRRVALKVLSSSVRHSEGSSAAGQRLLREAQAMAKLAHPNVVTAFEVGMFGDQVFLAMEYIDGPTLRVWRNAAPRTTREIVAMYVQAGCGLEAAHAAGILHRDFKPENVVVDARGRPRVLDFGLARIDAPPASLSDHTLESTETALKAPALPLTEYGSLVGTPAYMAPEQLLGQWAETYSDQFSFCVALYEALYDGRPHSGSTVSELLTAIHENRVAPAPAGVDVPRGVRAVLLRGLRADPKERFASVGEMLDALERALPPAAGRNVVALSALLAVVAVGAIGAAFALRTPRAPICAGADKEIAGVWGDAQRVAVERAFTASGNPRAAATWARVRPALDAYAARWSDMRTESCQSTRVRGVQSDEALDLRTACLDQRRAELAATVDLLAGANAKLVDSAVSMARDVTDLSQCADVPALRAPFAQPHDPAQRRAVAAIRDEIAKGNALVHARKHEEAIALLSTAAEEAKAAKNRALEAAALYPKGLAQNARGKSAEALATLVDAATEASIGRDDTTEARAWVLAVRAAGYDLGDFDASQIYARFADAAIVRAGDPDALRADLVRYRAHALYTRGKHDEALVLYRESLTLRERAFGAGSTQVGAGESDVADIYFDRGELREARTLYESALAKEVAGFGEGHPQVSAVLVNLAELYLEAGDPDAAVAMARRTMAAVEEGDTARAAARMTLARGLLCQGDVAGGREEARQADVEMSRSYGEDSWQRGSADVRLAVTLFERRQIDAAAPMAEHAIKCLSGKGVDAGSLAIAGQVRQRILVLRGHAATALAEAERGLAAEQKEGGETSLSQLVAFGEAALAAGQPSRALSALERATALAETAEGYPELHADAHLAVARALVATHADPTRARQMAERAAREYEKVKLPELATAARALEMKVATR